MRNWLDFIRTPQTRIRRSPVKPRDRKAKRIDIKQLGLSTGQIVIVRREH